ncbi:tagatose 1,6-diphosphate aldolase [Lophiostoma macrostomum CBS 122681]|uniref:Fructose-bisphosphate aldolase n=1 Tax=Lophiostoma macrostomum CBS 122681 TaxID=1314788 RepID=A0A6A6TGW3_9PLEO|nr:tagatose 1,6-diphosphate aldolase [Lophiostoma macrostomum CBS 122681]
MDPASDWKEKNKSIRVLRAAEKDRYGVIAAIAYNIEHILGFVKAAEVAQSPIIIQFFPWAVTYSSGLLIRAAADAISHSSMRDHIVLHMDHAQDYDLIKQSAGQLPFDSIMVDMSHYEKEENLSKTRELVAYCQQRGIATEAEPGRIEGGEDGVVDTAELEGSKTTPEEVDDFIATGVDALAPAFGNMHGEYDARTGPRLDFQRLHQIREKVNRRVSIALHGTNGFSPALLEKCIAEGCTKINVNRIVLDNYYAHLRQHAATLTHTQLMEEGTQKVVDLTVRWMGICGSAGKARLTSESSSQHL